MPTRNKNADEYPDCPCYEQQPTYTMCQKCYWQKTCVGAVDNLFKQNLTPKGKTDAESN